MVKEFKRIGVLTSGGDAPGMNAAIRSIVRSAISRGIEVMGIYCGYKGLLENDMSLLSPRDVSNIINHGGTMLYSNRCDKFKEKEGILLAVENCKKNGIDGIITLGGDGTFRGATDLSRHGIPCIGIPCTIDNDISATDYTIGYDTAKNTVIQMVDRLRDTCESHARCNVVEVMGRNAGYIAIDCGIAVGSTGIAIPELPLDKDALIKKISKLHKDGKRNFIIVVSEGMGKDFSASLVKEIEEKTGIETRLAVLAHVQRGGSPTCEDRLIASRMGDKAVDLLLEGNYNQVVCYTNGNICVKEMEYAFTLDRIVKHKATEEELSKLDPAVKEQMLKRADALHNHFADLYDLANCISI